MIDFLKHKWLLIVAIYLLRTGAQAQTTSTFTTAILPVPQQSALSGKSFPLDKSWTIHLNNIDQKIPAILSLQGEMQNRFHLKLSSNPQSQSNFISLIIRNGAVDIGKTIDSNRAALSRQAYRIELSANKIVIAANADQGLFYGVQTLLQLLQPKDQQLTFPEGKLTDWPEMNLRMIYWDDAHHLEKMEVLKREIKQASFYKINGFALKLEAHFQYQSAAAIVEPHALSPVQYQELTNYAAAHYVQLIPYLDAPAHVSFILKHPEFKELRSFPNSNYEITVGNPTTYALLANMFKELIDANKGVDYIYLSTDEAYYIGKALSEIDASKAAGGNGRLLAQFISRMADTLTRYGRKVIIWGEYPMNLEDIQYLPANIINGEYDSSWAPLSKERGIGQLIYTSTQGEEPLFPNYYPLPSGKTLHEENAKLSARVPDMANTINQAIDQKKAILQGVVVAGWADAGLHPQTFWLGYATGTAMAWNHSGASADELAQRFYSTFYRTENPAIKRAYELLSRQAQFYEDSWEWSDLGLRAPIFGNHLEVYAIQKPAMDQTLPILPLPDSVRLTPTYHWTDSNQQRLQLAQSFLKESDELISLLNKLNAVPENQYNIEVMRSIAALCRQNINMLLQLKHINESLQAAATQARINPAKAIQSIDQSLDLIAIVKSQRNKMLDTLIEIWYKDWLSLVPEANGRKYLQAVDDVKDHRPIRTPDMSYLIYRELNYPMDQWAEETLKARNEFALKHSIKQRSFVLNWKDYSR